MSSNKQQLIKYFSDLYLIEKKAFDTYTSYLVQMTSQEDTKIVQGVIDDEARHMKIAKQLLRLVK